MSMYCLTDDRTVGTRATAPASFPASMISHCWRPHVNAAVTAEGYERAPGCAPSSSAAPSRSSQRMPSRAILTIQAPAPREAFRYPRLTPPRPPLIPCQYGFFLTGSFARFDDVSIEIIANVPHDRPTQRAMMPVRAMQGKPLFIGCYRRHVYPKVRRTALRRQRSHVRIVSGAPIKSGTSRFLAEANFCQGKHRVSSRGSFEAVMAETCRSAKKKALNDYRRIRSCR